MDKEGFLGDRPDFSKPDSRAAADSGPALDRDVLARAARAAPGCLRALDDAAGGRSRSASDQNGAYKFAWGFGFFQFLFEFGASSALQRQISDAWTRGDHDAVDRSIACGMTFYTVVAVLQMAALLAVGYCALPATALDGRVVPLDRQDLVAANRDGPVLRIFGAGLERAASRPALRLHAAARAVQHDRAVRRSAVGLKSGVDFFVVVVAQTALQIGMGFVPGLWVMIRELGHRPAFPRRASARLQVAAEFQLLHRAHPDQRRAGRQGRYDDAGLHPRRSGPGQYGLRHGRASRSCSSARRAGCWPTW